MFEKYYNRAVDKDRPQEMNMLSFDLEYSEWLVRQTARNNKLKRFKPYVKYAGMIEKTTERKHGIMREIDAEGMITESTYMYGEKHGLSILYGPDFVRVTFSKSTLREKQRE